MQRALSADFSVSANAYVGPDTEFTDQPLPPVKWWYRVGIEMEDARIRWSRSASATPEAGAGSQSKPILLVDAPDQLSVRLEWTPVLFATRYVVEASDADGPWTAVHRGLEPSARLAGEVMPGRRYRVRGAGLGDQLVGDWSDPVDIRAGSIEPE